MLVLVAGSEQFLQLIKQKGGEELMAEDDAIHTRLERVRDDDGTMRWRIDIVDHEQVLPRSHAGSTAYVPVPDPAG